MGSIPCRPSPPDPIDSEAGPPPLSFRDASHLLPWAMLPGAALELASCVIPPRLHTFLQLLTASPTNHPGCAWPEQP